MKTRPRRVEKPWGHETIWAETPLYVGKILHVNAGEALSLQYHEHKDETFFVFRGAIELQVEENGELIRTPLVEGDSYHVSPPTRHRMIAGDEGCDLFEVSTPELHDVVRLEDRYGRA